MSQAPLWKSPLIRASVGLVAVMWLGVGGYWMGTQQRSTEDLKQELDAVSESDIGVWFDHPVRENITLGRFGGMQDMTLSNPGVQAGLKEEARMLLQDEREISASEVDEKMERCLVAIASTNKQ